jgi:hypothetical protein
MPDDDIVNGFLVLDDRTSSDKSIAISPALGRAIPTPCNARASICPTPKNKNSVAECYSSIARKIRPVEALCHDSLKRSSKLYD